MRALRRNPGRRTIAIAWLAAVVACAPAADVSPSKALDRSVARFVAGDYREAIAGLEAVVAATEDDAVRREAYAYIGRAHMALGETDEAIAAFTLGTRYGDRGVCVEYLEMLKPHVEGAPGSLHMNEAVTRGQLAGAIVRIFEVGDGSEGQKGPTPIARLEARGWLAPAPDGRAHAEHPVSRAEMYVIVARMLSESGLSNQLSTVLPGGYRRAVAAQAPLAGTDAVAILERVRALKEAHGR